MPTPDLTAASEPATPNGSAHRGHRRPPRRFTTKFLVLFLAVATLLGGFTALGPQSQGTATAPAHDDDDPETQLWVRGHSES